MRGGQKGVGLGWGEKEGGGGRGAFRGTETELIFRYQTGADLGISEEEEREGVEGRR